MPRDVLVYLEDILEAAKRITTYTQNHKSTDFGKDFKTVDAVVRNLEIIGEAVKKIPDPIRQKYPNIEWQKITGLRDILVHEYFGIDTEIIWDVIQTKLPTLHETVSKMIEDLQTK